MKQTRQAAAPLRSLYYLGVYVFYVYIRYLWSEQGFLCVVEGSIKLTVSSPVQIGKEIYLSQNNKK
jgi:hypothetical protein